MCARASPPTPTTPDTPTRHSRGLLGRALCPLLTCTPSPRSRYTLNLKVQPETPTWETPAAASPPPPPQITRPDLRAAPPVAHAQLHGPTQSEMLRNCGRIASRFRQRDQGVRDWGVEAGDGRVQERLERAGRTLTGHGVAGVHRRRLAEELSGQQVHNALVWRYAGAWYSKGRWVRARCVKRQRGYGDALC